MEAGTALSGSGGAISCGGICNVNVTHELSAVRLDLTEKGG